MKLETQLGQLKRLLQVVSGLLVLMVLSYGLVVVVVNHARPMPPRDAVRDGRLSATAWLIGHRDEVLSDDNAMLWSMVARSAELTKDPALKDMVEDYLDRYMLPNINSPYRQLFGLPYQPMHWEPETLQAMQDYHVFLLFALTCAPELSALERVAAQQAAEFCPENQPLRPACATHQLMGLRLAAKFGCLPPGEPTAVKNALLDRIERQLYWDVRLVDTYIQRTLMLTEERGPSGAGSPALNNVLSMRMPDGGWSRSQPIVPLGSGKWFGVKEGGFGFLEKRGEFHSTAQALLLLSLVEAGREGPA